MTDDGFMISLKDRAFDAAENTAKAPDIWAYLKQLERCVEECQALVKRAAVEEVGKYGKHGVAKGDLVLTVKAGAGRWNYSTVSQHKELTDKIKKLESLSQMAYRTGGMIPDDDGVEVQPAVYLAGSDTVVCTKKLA